MKDRIETVLLFILAVGIGGLGAFFMTKVPRSPTLAEKFQAAAEACGADDQSCKSSLGGVVCRCVDGSIWSEYEAKP